MLLMTSYFLALISSKTKFLFIGLQQQLAKLQSISNYYSLCSQSWLHFLSKTLPSLIIYDHCLGPATTTFVNYATFVHTLTSKQATPLPHLLYISNLTTVTL